jgi:phosphotransferase system, enzyme I, PtsP
MNPATDIQNRELPPSIRLLQDLRKLMAGSCNGQDCLNKVVRLIARNMNTDVCSVYFVRSDKILELSATEGLKREAVHKATLPIGSGLVGLIAENARVINTDNAPLTKGYQYLPETGEEIFTSFVGVPIQRLGRVLGVLVVQNKTSRLYTPVEVDTLETVAMVLAEISSTGRLTRQEITGEDLKQQTILRGTVATEGIAIGTIVLHEPKIEVLNPIADDIQYEQNRLETAMKAVRQNIDYLIGTASRLNKKGEHHDVLETFRMFAHDDGWMRRLKEAIDSGLSAEAAVEKVQSQIRARLARIPDAYLRERLSDMDDLANRLLRKLTGQNKLHSGDLPDAIILVTSNIGPAELLEYSRTGLKGVILKEGAAHSHAAIVARALNIPLLVQLGEIEYELDSGDPALIDGEQGLLIIHPKDDISNIYKEKLALRAQQQASLRELRDLPCITQDGVKISLLMNAGILADLPSIIESGAEGVGLYRTELQFMIRSTFPKREEQIRLYRQVLEAAKGRPVTFRTLDIGADKILPYLKLHTEENPALGWRAIRVGLDRPLLMKMQFEAMLRGATGFPLRVMFPMVSEATEFIVMRDRFLQTHAELKAKEAVCTDTLEIGAMLETPSLAYAPDSFYRDVDFISVGGNDLLQFFYAADRNNDLVAQRYTIFNAAFLRFLQTIISRATLNNTPISFCGEAAGHPLPALLLTALGFRALSMRPAAIALVKRTLRSVTLAEVTKKVNALIHSDTTNIREDFEKWVQEANIAYRL